MKSQLLEFLRCPSCTSRLELRHAKFDAGEVESGELYCCYCKGSHPVRDFIPRFVGSENYARGFGFQWNLHPRTQIDSFNGTRISADRFYEGTKWRRKTLKGQRVLEVGCGAGRFTDVMLDAGLEVYSLDYSNAVETCLKNHGLHPNLHVIQADIYQIPIQKECFDKVFCFGVLQHTPEVEKSFRCLTEFVRHGGEIAVDIYPRTFGGRFHPPRYLLRPLAKRLPPHILYGIVKKTVRLLLPVSVMLKSIPLVGKYLYPAIPVANYWRDIPLDKSMLYEWSVIDTFDWLASWYDQPQKASTLARWFMEAGFDDVDVRRLGSYVGTGMKPINHRLGSNSTG